MSAFTVTPHKVSVCILLQIYALPSHSLPYPFSSVSHHNRLGFYLFALTKSYDDYLEPRLEDLVNHLRGIGGSLGDWLIDQLTARVSSFLSPDDLFNFFSELRGILGASDSVVMEDNQVFLEPISQLGLFLRRFILAFNLLSFEGICHLLTNIGIYSKEALSSCLRYELGCSNSSTNDLEALSEYENMDLETLVFDKVNEEIEAKMRGGEEIPFHLHVPRAFSSLVEDIEVITESRSKQSGRGRDTSASLHPPRIDLGDVDTCSETFLRTSWQVQGYLMEQIDVIEKHGSAFNSNAFELILGQIKRLAPELHRVHYLAYLNDLHHDDYFSALENLHRYFDYSAGTEGLEFPLSSTYRSPERYEIALLCLGMMHFHFGHPKLALEALIEAVRVSHQQSNESCLAYTLAAICNLLSEIGGSSTARILGNSYSPMSNVSTSLSVKQQLFVLLRGSLKRADNLRLKRLVASNHLAIAKFDLMSIWTPEEKSQLEQYINYYLTGFRNLYFLHVCKAGSRVFGGAEEAWTDETVLRGMKSGLLLHWAYPCLYIILHVQRPPLSFGPKASMKLRTCPISVCKEIRLCSNLISEFGSESSTMMTDGAFSTSWLSSFSKPTGSLLLSLESGTGTKSSALQFCAQPSSLPKSVLQLIGSSYLLRATAWEMYGSAPLARINALVYATCFADTSSSSDAALAHAKLIQHLALFLGYKEAFSALRIAEEKFISVSRSVILPVKLQLLHEHALHRGCLKLAQQICDELGVLASSVHDVDMALKIEASFRHARTLLAANEFRQAVAVAHSLFCMCYKLNMQVENASILLLLAEIHKKSGNAVMGIPYALASLSFCQMFNLDLLKASANVTLAELWLSIGSNHAKRALTLIHGALPMVLGHGGLELCARAQITEAKCYLSDPSYSVFEDPEVVLDPLKQASDKLQVLEYHDLAAEAFYLMSVTYDKLGEFEKREEAAASFKKHIMALENPGNQDDPLLKML